MRKHGIAYGLMAAVAAWCVVVLMGCIGTAETSRTVDSLNWESYHMRYANLDSSENLANSALKASKKGSKGRAEALGNLGFVEYMKMDYAKAESLFKESYDECDEDITRMMALIGLMKICHHTSKNKEYYDYSMKAKELSGGADFSQYEWNYAMSEFYLSSASFYSNLMQDREARECFRMVRDNPDWIKDDVAQTARYFQLFASIGQGSVDDNLKLQYLTDMYVKSSQNDLIYTQANALQQIAEYLVRNPDGVGKCAAFRQLLGTENVPDDSLAIHLADRALRLYKQYGSRYSRVLAYITIDNYLLQQGEPERALDSALVAAQLAEIEVRGERLEGRGNVALDWVAKIHEHLSIVYGSLGDKVASDEHRNAYLDILDQTRQDKFYEQRVEVLENDKEKLNHILLLVYIIGGLILIGILVFTLLIRKRQKQKRHRELELLSEEKQMLELRLAKNKRGYIDKCTSLSIVNGIRPFLSRAIRALKDGGNNKEYVEELFEKISEYNDVLTHWIKIKQGEVKLQVESFPLQPLFDTLSKSRNAFDSKGISLVIHDTELSVKADKTLTLFMMNTLLDNARKFTDKGSVELKAQEGDNYVEISVKDTGRGITTNEDHDGKGYGFGLMNCRGIIEKYRKTSRIFNVCCFNVESKVGEGSTFSFRLPKTTSPKSTSIILKEVLVALAFISSANLSANETGRLLDMTIPDNPLLTEAHEYADSAFYCNVDGNYERTFEFADSVIDLLNKYYQQQHPGESKLMVKSGGRYMPELDWWDEGFVTDYITILDIRNELAIASLALNKIGDYVYNNNIYTRLYKLCGQDKSLENYCESLNKTNSNIKWAILVAVLLILIGLTIFYFAQRYWLGLNNAINKDENRRMEYEDNNLHIQNMILDNCLSTIKHETMYYPSRILNLLKEDGGNKSNDAYELATYYEEVFGMLSEHAMKQLENVQFKRKTIEAQSLVDYFGSLVPGFNPQNSDNEKMCILGDEEMLKYMIENLVQLAKEHEKNVQDLQFYFVKSEGFVKFAFEERGMESNDEDMSLLFYPDNLKYDASEDALHGTQYLICKQIIREHDEHCGRRGCRIYAERGERCQRIVFTLPIPKNLSDTPPNHKTTKNHNSVYIGTI